MINKEQAETIADQLIAGSAKTNPAPDAKRVIKRDNRNLAVVAAISPIFINGLFRLHDPHIAWIYGVLAAAYLPLFLIFIYHCSTPFATVGPHDLVFFGLMPWNRKTIALAEIERATFCTTPNRFRCANSLTLKLAERERIVWLPYTRCSVAPATRAALAQRLGERYAEEGI